MPASCINDAVRQLLVGDILGEKVKISYIVNNVVNKDILGELVDVPWYVRPVAFLIPGIARGKLQEDVAPKIDQAIRAINDIPACGSGDSPAKECINSGMKAMLVPLLEGEVARIAKIMDALSEPTLASLAGEPPSFLKGKVAQGIEDAKENFRKELLPKLEQAIAAIRSLPECAE